MDNKEIIIEDEIISFENTPYIDKCLIYTFTFFLVMIFGLLLFIIIFMIYNYLMIVFI